MNHFFDVMLWIASLGHFVVLVASAQVPGRLGWKADLAKLTPFNRKLMWTYFAFTVMTIFALGLLTLVLHQELLEGDRAALALALFVGIFWCARILVDIVYFDHHDWPPGAVFIWGHILLTATFVGMAGTFLGLVAWHAFF